ncbi:MAG: phosphonate metabolism transcriptional regulator PhnF [Bacillota bacterium]
MEPTSARPAGVNHSIDRTSPVPYYYQVKEALKYEITSGAWPPGSQLPSEAEICRTFGVSRTTVRQALAELFNEGLIRREKGRGTFVAEPKIRERLVERLTGFYEDMIAQGLRPETRVLDQCVIDAPRTLAEVLSIPEASRLVRIERLRLVNGEPIQLVVTYIPHDMCPGLEREDLEHQSLYALLEHKFHLRLARGRRIIEAIAASENDARLLGIPKGAPLVLLKSVSFLDDGRPLEYYEAKHRGDRSRFEVELIRVGPVAADDPQLEKVPAVTAPAWGITGVGRQGPQAPRPK